MYLTWEIKKWYIIDIRNLIQASNQVLVLKKKSKYEYECRTKKKAKYDCEKYFFNLMNKSVFGKTMENVRKHRVIKREKKGETIWYPHQTIIQQLSIMKMLSYFSQKI